jgi:choline dehydrogenase
LTDFDYIIVGAGSAGCVLAERLSADKHTNVLLLEAGGKDNKFWIQTPLGYGRTYYDKRVNWSYSTAPDPGLSNRQGYWPRGKVLGGSSSINAMVYFRGLPHDFDDWASAGNPLWNWQSVESEYKKIENIVDSNGAIHGGGPLTISDPGNNCHSIQREFLQSASKINLPHNPNLIGGEGVGRYRMTIRKGRRCSTASAFLHPALKRPNLSLMTQVNVKRVLVENGKATGVVFDRRGSEYKVYCRREVIVSGGAINSPKLLMLSGIGDPAELHRHGIPIINPLPGVGKNLQDHLALTYTYRCTRKTLNNRLAPWWGKAAAGAQYFLTRRGPLAMSINQFGGLVRSSADRDYPDTQLYCSPLSYTTRTRGDRSESVIDPFPGFILSYQPCRPLSRGRIRLVNNKPDSAPAIHPGSLQEPEDLDDIVRGGRLCERLIQTSAFQSLIDEPLNSQPDQLDDMGLVEDFKQRAATVYHPIGTCRMGPDSDNSVVDQHLRVHGTENLRVIDASVFPNLTSGNTNAPTIMLAHRSAELIINNA